MKIKPCNGCEIKSMYTKSKRSTVKKRCLFEIDSKKTIQLKVNSVQGDFLMDTSIFESLALVENLVLATERVNTDTNISKQPGLNVLCFLYPRVLRNKLEDIANKLKEYEEHIEIYTDGSVKNIKQPSVQMGCAFYIKQ